MLPQGPRLQDICRCAAGCRSELTIAVAAAPAPPSASDSVRLRPHREEFVACCTWRPRPASGGSWRRCEGFEALVNLGDAVLDGTKALVLVF